MEHHLRNLLKNYYSHINIGEQYYVSNNEKQGFLPESY